MKYLIILFLLTSCSKTKYFPELPIFKEIIKSEVLWSGGESTPIVFDDELYYISVGVGQPYKLDVRNAQGQVIHSHVSHLEYISAYNDNGTVYVIGSNADKSALMITSSTDLINWTEQRQIIGGGMKYFNSSITKTDDGFVMAYEVCANGFHCFNTMFLKTRDFITWEPIGRRIFEDTYTACPTIRYINGTYYLLFVANFPARIGREEHWATYAAKSTDLINWQHGKYQVLSAMDNSEDAPNASDIDLVEYNGQVHIIYLNTAQITKREYKNVGSRYAYYNGTLESMFLKLF